MCAIKKMHPNTKRMADTEVLKILQKCTKDKAHSDVNFLKAHLRRLIKGNWIVIIVNLLIVSVCVLMIGFLVNTIFNLLQRYNSSFSKKTLELQKDVTRNKDDFLYKSKDDSSIPMTSEHILLKHNIDKLKRLYKPHNEYRANVTDPLAPEASPDDMIDENILSRSEDTYNYVKATVSQATGSYPVPS